MHILLKLLGAKIDVGKGVVTLTSSRGGFHSFPKKNSKGKKGRRKASAINNVDASSLENT
jgi:hypothetical protein